MFDSNMAWFFAFGFGFITFTMLVKNYIDSNIARLDSEIKDARRNIFNQLDTMFTEMDRLENKVDTNCSANKAMSKSYYNSDAGCCKTAQEYLKG